MSTSPVATTVSDAGAAETVAAGSPVGAGPQPVSTATPSAASAIRIRRMRCPLPTAGSVEGATASAGASRADRGPAGRSTTAVATAVGLEGLSGGTATSSGWAHAGGWFRRFGRAGAPAYSGGTTGGRCAAGRAKPHTGQDKPINFSGRSPLILPAGA